MYVADYVLMEYGTGAIMAVPAHDERDFAFAKAYDLPIRQVVAPRDGSTPPERRGLRHQGRRRDPRQLRRVRRAHPEARASSGSSPGSTARASATPRSTSACATGCVSRQRYWGCPIPIIYCDELRHGAGARGPAAGRAARRRGLPAQGPLAAGRRRGLGQHHLPELRRPRAAARPTRWTPSSTRAGTSCATATPATTRPPGIRRCCASGWPSTSTSAASSTRSCTCCTRASSSRRSPTWTCSTSRSRSTRCSPRA